MSRLKSRVRRLEDHPRTPAQKQRQAEAEKRIRERIEQTEALYARRAEERPDLYEDLIEAMDEMDAAFEKAGIDKNQPDLIWAIRDHPAVNRAIDRYVQELFRFFNS